MLRKLISGGQTGVDRAALDVAMQLGIACGGWCPRGRRAEDGTIAACYPLFETTSTLYRQRTAKNVRQADATLLLARGVLQGGTALTAKLAASYAKPALIIDLNDSLVSAPTTDWLLEKQVRVLNVAGPRESQCPGIYQQASEYLQNLLVVLLAATGEDTALSVANR